MEVTSRHKKESNKNQKMEPKTSPRRLQNGVKITRKTAFWSFWATYSLQTVPKTPKICPKVSLNAILNTPKYQKWASEGATKPENMMY